jgi:hypothetical protein
VLAAGLLAGCSMTGSSASGPLVSVELRGGEGAAGPCGTTVVLERDGRVHEAAKPPNELGQVPADQVAAIDAAIKLTDFAVLRSHAFTGECPVNFDGQEVIYEFSAPSGVERIASCEVDIDLGSPLFVAVATALAPFVPLPVT